MRILAPALLIAAIGSPAWAATALEVLPAPGFVSEAEAVALNTEGSLSTCMLETTLYSGEDFCTYLVLGIPVPMACQRLDMNSAMGIIEGSDSAGFLGYAGPTTMFHMEIVNQNCNPTEKRLAAQIGDMVSCSVATHGHIINLPLLNNALKKVLTAFTAYNLCTPVYELSAMPIGYAFVSEGDHFNGTEFGNWRGQVSFYWFTPWLIPITAVARFMERFGFCESDYFRLYCYGGWGTRYPATGSNPAESRGLGLIDSSYDGFNVTTAPLYTYGPLHVNPGAPVCIPAHLPLSWLLGSTANYATFQRGGWTQPLYPIRQPTCTPVDVPATDLIPNQTQNMPQMFMQPVAETNQIAVQDQNRVATTVLWPRFTCCNWCIGSVEAPARHMAVGFSFDSTLLPWAW